LYRKIPAAFARRGEVSVVRPDDPGPDLLSVCRIGAQPSRACRGSSVSLETIKRLEAMDGELKVRLDTLTRIKALSGRPASSLSRRMAGCWRGASKKR